MTESGTVNPLRQAAAVAIVIHGVGDHSHVDILRSATEGLEAIGSPSSEVIDLPGLTPSNQAKALHFGVSTKEYFVIPVVWSRARMRLIEGIETADPIPLAFIEESLPAFVAFVVNLLRCVPETFGWRRVAMVLASLVLSTLTIAIPAACLWVFGWHINYVSQDWLGRGPSILLVFLVFLIPFLVGLVWTALGHVLDFAGDVAAYIASPSHRETQLMGVRNLLSSLANLAPSAQLVLVGHSLGSVLASHALLNPPEKLLNSGRVMLVTAGSPLASLPLWFPRVVQAPQALWDSYQRDRSVKYWANFWRDDDGIGRALGTKSSAFAEATLGEGGHTNYWRDVRLWQCVAQLLTVRDGEGFLGVARAWRPRYDLQGRTETCQRAIRHHTRMLKFGAVMFFCLLGSAFAGLTRYRAGMTAGGYNPTFWVLWSFGIASWLTLVWATGRLDRAGSDLESATKASLWFNVSIALGAAVASSWVGTLALFVLTSKSLTVIWPM